MSVLHSYIGPICYDIMHIYFIYVFGEKIEAVAQMQNGRTLSQAIFVHGDPTMYCERNSGML